MITWRLFPFVRIAFVFCLGIVFQRSFPSHSLIFIILAVVTIAYVVFIHVTRRLEMITYSSVTILVLFFSLAYLRTEINHPTASTTHYSHYTGQFTSGIGVIQEIPIKRTSLRTEIDINQLCDDQGKCQSASGRAVIYFKIDDTLAAKYGPGDEIYFRGLLKEVNSNTNPHAFDFKVYLFNRGITHQVYAWGTNAHRLLNQNQLSFLTQLAMNLRARFLLILDKYVPDKNINAVSAAMILGYKNMVNDDMYKAFSDSGAVHILAVSGMHLGILSLILSYFVDKVNIKYKYANLIRFIFILSILWFFALITGNAPAMLRAAVMFTFILYAKYFKSSANIFNILALCALLMLIWNPYMLFQASFQFSFAAMLSLTFFHPYIKNWYKPRYKYFDKILWDLTSVALAAQVLVVPITIYFFHKFPLYFVITGVISVYVSTLALNVGLAIFLFEFIFAPINLILAPVFNLLMKIFIYSVTMVKALPFCSLDGLILNQFDFIIIYIGLVALMLYLAFKEFKHLKVIFGMVCLLFLSMGWRYHSANHQLGFTLYDVKGNTILDIFDGRKVYLKTLDASKDNLAFINLNNRIFKSSENIFEDQVALQETGRNIRVNQNLIQLKDKVLLICDGTEQDKLIPFADYIVVLNEAYLHKEINLKSGATIYMDRNVKPYKAKLWNDYAYENNYEIHNVKADGAITINIK